MLVLISLDIKTKYSFSKVSIANSQKKEKLRRKQKMVILHDKSIRSQSVFLSRRKFKKISTKNKLRTSIFEIIKKFINSSN